MTQSTPEPRKHHVLRGLIFTLLKIAIAVVGLWYVIAHTPWNDVATLKQGTQIAAWELMEPVDVTVLTRQLLGERRQEPVALKVSGRRPGRLDQFAIALQP